MRQDFFTFKPSFKLLLMGNYKPVLRNVDEAIRRRFFLIPFLMKIEQPDQRLPEKLVAEWPGILQWAIQGCLDWQRQGLVRPAAVANATGDYMEAEDTVGQWITECCREHPSLWNPTGVLFSSWCEFAGLAGETPGSQKRFAQALTARGFTSKREAGTGRAGFCGIAAVRAPASASWSSL
jgi:putative DNA primase/helicase